MSHGKHQQLFSAGIHGLHRLRYAAMGTIAFLAIPLRAFAAVYDGSGLIGGLKEISGIDGIVTATSITELLLRIILFILDLVLIVAMLAIIVAGVYLIVSNGDEAQKDKAKKIVFYVIAGILLILFSRAIVMIINGIFS